MPLMECLVAAVGGDSTIASMILKRQTERTGVTWETASKKDIMKVIDSIRDIAGTFRDSEIIHSNYLKMKGLVNKCEEC
ncbi:MAG: hypothetical protein J7L61_02700 [Thermoplasmata archaeon]|nr:hypothetical protein [Thermoplasmata archaeon]